MCEVDSTQTSSLYEQEVAVQIFNLVMRSTFYWLVVSSPSVLLPLIYYVLGRPLTEDGRLD